MSIQVNPLSVKRSPGVSNLSEPKLRGAILPDVQCTSLLFEGE